MGVGAEGTVFVIGTNKVGGGYGIYRKATGPYTTIFATMTQQGANWKEDVKYQLVQHDDATTIEANGDEIWATGNFNCADHFTI